MTTVARPDPEEIGQQVADHLVSSAIAAEYGMRYDSVIQRDLARRLLLELHPDDLRWLALQCLPEGQPSSVVRRLNDSHSVATWIIRTTWPEAVAQARDMLADFDGATTVQDAITRAQLRPVREAES